MTTLIADKCPEERLSLLSRAVVRDKSKPYAKVTVPGMTDDCYLTVESHSKMESGKIGLNGLQVWVWLACSLHLTACV